LPSSTFDLKKFSQFQIFFTKTQSKEEKKSELEEFWLSSTAISSSFPSCGGVDCEAMEDVNWRIEKKEIPKWRDLLNLQSFFLSFARFFKTRKIKK